MTQEAIGPILVFLALLARALMAAVATHWAGIGVLFVMGDDPDHAGPITTAAVVGLVAATLFGMRTALKQPSGRERMAAGPGVITQWRALVFAVGGASELGGLLVFLSGHQQAGGRAMGIGTAMVAFEVAAIVGAAARAASDRETLK